jgi:hypothetical protein
MRDTATPKGIRAFWARLDDGDTFRVQYCYSIGSTFTVMALMEDSIIQAMHMCSRIKLKDRLGPDASNWEKFLERRSQLRDSTLGSLVAILEKHGINAADISYLRWVKSRRDYFVHRFFHDAAWPGDLTERDATVMARRLRYLELIFHRAGQRIWPIFGRADLLEYNELGDGSVLVMNHHGLSDALSESGE